MIEMSLGDLDYRILTAVDGKAARQVLQSDEAIDLLLTDIVMPNGVCGLEIGKIGKRSTASAIGARGCRRVGLPPRLREPGRPRVWFDFPRKAVPADGPCRHDSRCAQQRQKVSCASRRFGRHRRRTPECARASASADRRRRRHRRVKIGAHCPRQTSIRSGVIRFPVISRLWVLLPGSVQHKFPLRRAAS